MKRRIFADREAIKCYIEQHKNYPDPCEITFLPQDYTDPINIDELDLNISQYAGFVGQAAKKYLKHGGILLCNDSHGDVEFVGVIQHSLNQLYSSFENTKHYFVLLKGKQIDLSMVRIKIDVSCEITNHRQFFIPLLTKSFKNSRL